MWKYRTTALTAKSFLRFVLRTMHTFMKLVSIELVRKATALIISAFFSKIYHTNDKVL